jgi:hypothetical protein
LPESHCGCQDKRHRPNLSKGTKTFHCGILLLISQLLISGGGPEHARKSEMLLRNKVIHEQVVHRPRGPFSSLRDAVEPPLGLPAALLINIRISWFWDGGIDVRLGDEINGFLAEESVRSIEEILPWLQEAIAHFYPSSKYAASLSPDVRERAAQRVFQPPRIGAQVICPYCGAHNANMMNEVFVLVCRRCGEPVHVKRLKCSKRRLTPIMCRPVSEAPRPGNG